MLISDSASYYIKSNILCFKLQTKGWVLIFFTALKELLEVELKSTRGPEMCWSQV